MLSKIKEYYMAKILLFLTLYFKFCLFKFILIFPYNKINRKK